MRLRLSLVMVGLVACGVPAGKPDYPTLDPAPSPEAPASVAADPVPEAPPPDPAEFTGPASSPSGAPVVGFDAPSCDEALASRAFANVVREVSQRTCEPVVHVVGTSLGAPIAVRAVGLLADEGGSPVGRVALVGPGLDYAYPRSFLARERAHLGGPAGYLCATVESCRRLSHEPEVLREHLAKLPPEAPSLFTPTAERYPGLSGRHEPVLLVVGKADGVAPSESSYPAFLAWGSATPGAARSQKRYFLAARENALGDDYDHAELFAGASSEDEIFAPVAEFVEGETD